MPDDVDCISGPPRVLPRLHDDWAHLLRRAWSIRFIIIAALLSGLEVVFSVFVSNPPFNPVWFSALAGLVSMAAFAARLVAQTNLKVSE